MWRSPRQKPASAGSASAEKDNSCKHGQLQVSLRASRSLLKALGLSRATSNQGEKAAAGACVHCGAGHSSSSPGIKFQLKTAAAACGRSCPEGLVTGDGHFSPAFSPRPRAATIGFSWGSEEPCTPRLYCAVCSTTDNTPSELGRGLRWGSGGDDLLASKSSVPGTRQPSFALSDVSEHRRTKRSGARDVAASFAGHSLFEHCAASPSPLGASGAAAAASVPHGSADEDDDAQAFWRALRAGVDVHKHASPLPRAAAEPRAVCNDGRCPRCATGHHHWSAGAAAARHPGASGSSDSGGCSSASEGGGGGGGGRSARSARAAALPLGRRAVRALARLLHGPGPVQAGGEGMVTLFADRAQSSLCWCVPGQSVLSPDTRASLPIEDIIHMDIAPISSPTTSAPRCLNPLPPTASPAATAAVTPIATDVTLWTASRALRFTVKGRHLQDLIVSGLHRMVDANSAAAARRVAAAAAEAPPHTAPLLSAALLRERLQRYAIVGAATTPSSASPPHRQRQPPPPPPQQQQPLRLLACTAASDDVLPPLPQGQLPPALAIAAAAQGWGGALPYARSSSGSSGTASPCDTPQHAVNFVSVVPFGPAF